MHYFRAQQFIFWIVLSISAHMIVFIAVIAFNGKNFELREVNYNLPIRIVETYFEESSENIPSQEATQYSTRENRVTNEKIEKERLKNLVLKSKERSSKLANFARDLSGMGQFNFNNQHTKSDHELHFDKNSNSLQTFSEGLKLPLGEINLLNTKSYRFADFIIRVAKRVFFQTVTEVQSKPQAFVGNFNEQFTAKYNTLGEIVEITSSKSELSQKLESIIGRYGKDSNPPLELFRNSEFLDFVFLFEIKNQKLGDSHRFYIRLTAGIP